MTTLTTGDLHVSENPRDEYRWLFLEQTLPSLIEKYRCNRLIVLGDLTDRKGGHSALLVNRLVDAFATLAKAVHIYCLRGNHDYVAEVVPFFAFLSHIKRIRWINQPTAFTLQGLGRCLFLPHTRDIAEWDEHLKFADYDWFFCHQTFSGADIGGRQLEGEQAPFQGTRPILAISGDIHVPQQTDKVVYVGAPYHVNFGDEYQPRVLLIDDHKLRSVPVSGPQKRLLTIAAPDELPQRIEAGDIYKIRVIVPRGSELSRTEYRMQCRSWADAQNVLLDTVQIQAPEARLSTISETARKRARSNDDDLVRVYAKKMRKGKATIAAGLKIMELAK